MIIFQISLSGRHIRHLLAIKHGQIYHEYPDNFISASHTLIREGLINHEDPMGSKADGTPFYRKGRKHHCEITAKGELVLQLIALDLMDFMNELRGEIGLPKLRDRK